MTAFSFLAHKVITDSQIDKVTCFSGDLVELGVIYNL